MLALANKIKRRHLCVCHCQYPTLYQQYFLFGRAIATVHITLVTYMYKLNWLCMLHQGQQRHWHSSSAVHNLICKSRVLFEPNAFESAMIKDTPITPHTHTHTHTHSDTSQSMQGSWPTMAVARNTPSHTSFYIPHNLNEWNVLLAILLTALTWCRHSRIETVPDITK